MRNLHLDDSGMEMRFWRRARDVFQQTNKHVAGLVRLNDGVYPAARGAIANVSLLFVTLFHIGAQLLQFFGRRFLVPSVARLGEDGKYRVRRLRGAHHCITSSGPRNDESRIVRLPAHGIVSGTE